MKSLLKALPSDDPRTKDCIILFETDEESDYKLTIVQKNLDVKLDGNEIDGFQRYLEYWEANPDKPLILHTKNAIHFEVRLVRRQPLSHRGVKLCRLMST